MKFGNTSQSIVPVPNFFLTRNLKTVDTFTVRKGRKYYKEKDLFKEAKEFNINNSSKSHNYRKYDEYNRTKYIPIHKQVSFNSTFKTSSSSTAVNKTINFQDYGANQNQKSDRVEFGSDNMLSSTMIGIESLGGNSIGMGNGQGLGPGTMTSSIMSGNNNTNNYNIIINNQGVNNNPNNPNNPTSERKSSISDDELDDSFNNGFSKQDQQDKDKTEKLSLIGKDYRKFKEYMASTDSSRFVNQNLSQNIKSNVSKLLDRINSNFDTQKWSNFDSKSVFNKVNDTQYTPITYYNMVNESETTKFRNTLQDKINSLNMLGDQRKNKLLETFRKTTTKKDLIDDNPHIDYSKIKPEHLPKINQENIDNITNENKFLYHRYKPTNLYKDFPSPTYSEFTKPFGSKFSLQRKAEKKVLDKKAFENNSIIDRSKYNAYNSKFKNSDVPYYENSIDGYFSKLPRGRDYFVVHK